MSIGALLFSKLQLLVCLTRTDRYGSQTGLRLVGYMKSENSFKTMFLSQILESRCLAMSPCVCVGGGGGGDKPLALKSKKQNNFNIFIFTVNVTV